MEIRNEKKASKLKVLYTNLPSELCTNHILPTLPVKTLLRFRSVCKLWRDTVDDPRFVSIHFALSRNNVDKNKVISIETVGPREKRTRRLTVRNKNTLRKQADLFQQPDFLQESDIYDYFFQVSCNGLFFVETRIIENILQTPRLRLWNPSMKKCLRIPPCPLPHHDVKSQDEISYLFGFKPSRNDYVVYVFGFNDFPCSNVSIAVYTLSDNNWNKRNYKLSVDPDLFSEPVCGPMCCNESVFHDGGLHWIRYSSSDLILDQDDASEKIHLISFDFDVEKFSAIELPDNSRAFKSWTYRFLFVLGGSVALFSISSEWRSIWVLKNKSWDLLSLGTSSSVGFNYIRKHPGVVTKVSCVEDGGIALVYGKVGYKIMSNEIKKMNKSMSSYLILDTYTESLVLHKGCQGQIIESL